MGPDRAKGMRRFTINYNLFEIITLYIIYSCDIQNGSWVRIVKAKLKCMVNSNSM